MAVLRKVSLSALLLAFAGCTDLLEGSDTLATVDSGLDGSQDEDAGDGSTLDCTPLLTLADYPVIAHTGRLTLSGSCLGGATEVRIGAVTHTPTEVTSSTATVTLLDIVAVGQVNAEVVTPRGTSNPLSVTVVHLTLDEVDAENSAGGMSRDQFVEIGTGLPSQVSLAGYAVVLVDGTTDSTYPSVASLPLQMTGSDGLLVLGNPDVTQRDQTFPNNLLGAGNDADALLIVQTKTTIPGGTPIGNLPTTIIDAVVFSRADPANDDALLVLAFPEAAERVQWNEGAAGGDADTRSIRRCGSKLRAGTVFSFQMPPSPGSANACP